VLFIQSPDSWCSPRAIFTDTGPDFDLSMIAPKSTEPCKKTRRRGPRERTQTSNEFYSRLQVAQKIGCGPSTIAELERLGRLTAYRFTSKLVRYPAAEVHALIEEARAK